MMKRSTSAARCALLALGAPLLSAVGVAAQTATLSVQLLGNISGGVSSYVAGINEAGEAAGNAGAGTAVCPEFGCAVIWHDLTPTVLAVEATSGSEASAMNNAGQVVGNAYATTGVTTAVVWNNGTPTPLPGPTPQYTNTLATAISDAGQVVGEAYPPADTGN